MVAGEERVEFPFQIMLSHAPPPRGQRRTSGARLAGPFCLRQSTPALSGVSIRTSPSLQPASKRRRVGECMPPTRIGPQASSPVTCPLQNCPGAHAPGMNATRQDPQHPPLGTSLYRRAQSGIASKPVA